MLEEVADISPEGVLPVRDPDRISLINQLVQDCQDGYCTVRMIVEKNGKTPVSCCAGSVCAGENCTGANCLGRAWCGNREIVYKSPMSPRTFVQMKLMEVRRYLDCKNEDRNEGWDETEGRWWDLVSGDTVIFRYVWDELGIRDYGALKRLVVESVVDNPPKITREPVVETAPQMQETYSFVPDRRSTGELAVAVA